MILADTLLGAGQDAELPLNWGAEGQEGPVLATGNLFSLLTRTCSIVTLRSPRPLKPPSVRDLNQPYSALCCFPEIEACPASRKPGTPMTGQCQMLYGTSKFSRILLSRESIEAAASRQAARDAAASPWRRAHCSNALISHVHLCPCARLTSQLMASCAMQGASE